MRRKCTDTLTLWKKNPSRKPLVLQGGRQTGKTWLLRDFGSRQYETTVYVNLETEHTAAKYFSQPRSSEDALLFLETYTDKTIRQSSTLVILDNIQCVPLIPELLSAISIDFPGYHVTAIKRGISGIYDTHDLELLHLYPLDFEEFLWANTEFNLAKEIRSHFAEKKPMGRQLHEKAMTQFHLYQIIGGMPEAILEYRKEKKLLMVPDIQQKILTLLQADITAQAPPGLARHCLNCWKSIPSQLGKPNNKFQYCQITKSGTSRLYQEPLKWLIDSGFVFRAFKCGEKFSPDNSNSLNAPITSTANHIPSSPGQKTDNTTCHSISHNHQPANGNIHSNHPGKTLYNDTFRSSLTGKTLDSDTFRPSRLGKTLDNDTFRSSRPGKTLDNDTLHYSHINETWKTIDENSFHLYFNDVGLSACHLGVPSYLLLTGEDIPSTRSCTETCLAQHFTQNGYTLTYWTSGNQAEVPFILEKAGHVTAITYRLTPHQKARSLTRFKNTCNVEKIYLLSTEDFKIKENYTLIPFYAVFCI